MKLDISFPDELAKALKKYCDDTGRSYSGYLQTLVARDIPKDYLKEVKKGK